MHPVGVTAIYMVPLVAMCVAVCNVLVSPLIARNLLGQPIKYDGTYTVVESRGGCPVYQNQHGALLVRRVCLLYTSPSPRD